MATQAEQHQNLEKVTDYVEETQLDAARMAQVRRAWTGQGGHWAGMTKLLLSCDQAMSSLDADDDSAAEAAKANRYASRTAWKGPEMNISHNYFPFPREWASVKVRGEDIDFIVGELEVSRELAEMTLKQHQGNVGQALRKLLE
jgi:NACalpha-BTF3-like transcription factor